jgi:hypothetical protein
LDQGFRHWRACSSTSRGILRIASPKEKKMAALPSNSAIRLTTLVYLLASFCFANAAPPPLGPAPDQVAFLDADNQTRLIGYVFKPEIAHAERLPAVVMMHGPAGAYSSLANGRRFDAFSTAPEMGTPPGAAGLSSDSRRRFWSSGISTRVRWLSMPISHLRFIRTRPTISTIRERATRAYRPRRRRHRTRPLPQYRSLPRY